MIGNIPVHGRAMLAPMDGYSDQPFRMITRELGSAVSYTEFINAIEVTSGNTKYQRRCAFSEEEKPVGIQLFDDNPERLLKAAGSVYELFKPDFIDVNMGCSVNQVANRGAGAGLLLEPAKINKIITDLVSHFPIPITAKIRLGWDETKINYLDIGKMIEDCGAAAIALHARTKEQFFNGLADWDSIGRLKQSLSIPVIGNGDILLAADVNRMLDYTKCDGVMIGRAAISNPWIFSGYDFNQVPDNLFRTTVFRHLELMKNHFGEERGCVVFRKYAKKFLLGRNVQRDKVRRLLTTVDPSQFTEMFAALVDEATSQAREILIHE